METHAKSSCNSSPLNLKDTTYHNLQKSKAILTCVMFATEFIRDDMALDNQTIYHALWAVDDYLENIETMLEQL
jgi:hypothetical protein